MLIEVYQIIFPKQIGNIRLKKKKHPHISASQMQASIYLHIQVADPPPWFPLTQPPVIGMQVKIKICVTIVFSSHEPI